MLCDPRTEQGPCRLQDNSAERWAVPPRCAEASRAACCHSPQQLCLALAGAALQVHAQLQAVHSLTSAAKAPGKTIEPRSGLQLQGQAAILPISAVWVARLLNCIKVVSSAHMSPSIEHGIAALLKRHRFPSWAPLFGILIAASKGEVGLTSEHMSSLVTTVRQRPPLPARQ